MARRLLTPDDLQTLLRAISINFSFFEVCILRFHYTLCLAPVVILF